MGPLPYHALQSIFQLTHGPSFPGFLFTRPPRFSRENPFKENEARAYILKAKKFAEPPFQSKKNCGLFLGHFGSFWVILGPFWAFLGHFGSYLGHFGSFLAIFARSQQKKLRKISGNFKFFCGPVRVAGSAFRM